MTHRPSRKHRDLLRKIEEKKERSRKKGNKLKRLEKWAKEYEDAAQRDGGSSDS